MYFLFLSYFTNLKSTGMRLKFPRVLIFLWRVFPFLKWAEKEVFIFMKDMNFWRTETYMFHQVWKGKKGSENLVATCTEKNNMIKMSKNLARHRFKNNFVGLSK